ncbi:DUF4173 domain-containing protein [Anaerobacillus sp. CMMVII]|nr:DUF4173 domain-containing protein [Anaerobacillus sp. CMMVII]
MTTICSLLTLVFCCGCDGCTVFQYLFSGTLQAGFSYAEYARRGFFELNTRDDHQLFHFNRTVTYVKNQQSKTIKVLLTY